MPRATGVERVRPWTDKQRAEIHSVLLREFGEFNFLDAQNIAGHEGEFGRDVAALRRKWSATNLKLELERLVEQRTKFCQTYYGLSPDFSQVVLPPMRPGFGWTSLIPMGLTAEHVYSACSDHFPCWKYTIVSLDDRLDWNTEERDARKGSYAIRIDDQVEVGKRLANLSADALATRDFTTVTLVERLDLELAFWVRKHQHLDVFSTTLCSGSRYTDGGIPGVCGGRSYGLNVSWCLPDRASVDLRSREVVVA